MLLARVAAELRTDAEFSGFLLPVRFMEESHEIFDVADFWLETLFHLARESAASYPELARELRETHSDLSGHWRERALGGPCPRRRSQRRRAYRPEARADG